MKITINQIKNIIKEELAKFLKKEKETCRDEYLDCGDTVPCFDKYLECEEDAVFNGVKAFRTDKTQKAEFARVEKEKQAELIRIEKEKQAEFDRMNREEQERIAKGIYNLYKFVDEQGGYVSVGEIPEELYQFLSTAEMEGNITDVSDEFETYSLGDAPGGYEEKKQERENMKKLIQVVFDKDRVPDWAVERKEDGSYYWVNYEQDPPETIEVPRDLEDLLDLD